MAARELPFEITESHEPDGLRLSLTGELDLAVASELEERLSRIRADRRSVRLDLSRLEFIDSTGLRVLIGAIHQSRSDGWRLEIERNVSGPVMRVFELTHVDRFISGAEINGH